MGTRLGELVERLGGQLVGDPNLEVSGIAPLANATGPDISFLSNSKLRAQAAQSGAAALIVAPADDATVAETYRGARIVTNNPYVYFARAAQYFAALSEVAPAPGIDPSASVAPGAMVDPSAHIGPQVTILDGAVIGAGVVIDAGCFIGRGAVIGEGTHLFANATFHARCEIGKRGIIHSGAVIGTDGFGFANEGGVYIKIPQTGRVMIGDDVDIGANTCIDRGALADTIIEDGVKLDNQIQIGHNCHIGAHTVMAACVGIAGSTRVGRNVMIGGAAMIQGHIEIVDGVVVSASTMVMHSLKKKGTYTAIFPVDEHASWEKNAVTLRNLYALRERVRALEKNARKE
ncbi:MAG: UDP-3-O-(3-hydroxymyristoyl)glucosamine N-acyltransferase [Caulobacter sp.]|nr:UDP-3-O-(3-hydroxymyristoyl)glucosamine N-acyltransferase [Vitreoscilla sp.]